MAVKLFARDDAGVLIKCECGRKTRIENHRGVTYFVCRKHGWVATVRPE